MVLFSSVHAGMSSEVSTGCEDPIASGANVLLLWNWLLDNGDYLLRFEVGGFSRLWIRGGASWIIVAVSMHIGSVRVIFRRGRTRHA